MLQLCYSALSPFCRKVRMAMDAMMLEYDLFDSGDITKYPAWNPRAEIPILVDEDTTVRNSATIIEYLHRRFPTSPSLLPQSPDAFAVAKEWELIADTMVDPIVTNVGIWAFADLRPMPDGLMTAAQSGLAHIYDQLEKQLSDNDYIAGALSVADIALYPQLVGAKSLGLAADPQRHPRTIAWIDRIKSTPFGQSDFKAVIRWWKSKDSQDVETDKINWGAYRLEWFLAHGFHNYFLEEIERDAVLWSVGPNNNAHKSPLADQNR